MIKKIGLIALFVAIVSNSFGAITIEKGSEIAINFAELKIQEYPNTGAAIQFLDTASNTNALLFGRNAMTFNVVDNDGNGTADAIQMFSNGSNKFNGISFGSNKSSTDGISGKAGDVFTIMVEAKLENDVTGGFTWKQNGLKDAFASTDSSKLLANGNTLYTSTFTLDKDYNQFQIMFGITPGAGTPMDGENIVNGTELGEIYGITVIPEPATLGLVGVAFAGLFASRRRLKK